MNVAVVILNWNGAHHLRTYLPSVVDYTPGAQLIVADNGSTDDSRSVVDSFAMVTWLQLTKNYGFAEGYNRALAQVNADVFVLLNSDVRVTPGWLDAPLGLLQSQVRVAAVQPKILADAKPSHYEYAGASGGFLDALGYPYCRGRVFDTLEVDNGQYDEPRGIHWASGACCFVRADAWRAVNGFDGSYFAHMEEIDLCWRLRGLGYEVWSAPASHVYHLGGGSLAYGSPRKTYLNFRNSLTTLLKNEPGSAAYFKLIARTALDAVACAKFLVAMQPRAALAVLRAHAAFYGTIGQTLAKRRVLATARAGKVQLNLSRFELKNPGVSAYVLPRVFSIVISYYLLGKRTFSRMVG